MGFVNAARRRCARSSRRPNDPRVLALVLVERTAAQPDRTKEACMEMIRELRAVLDIAGLILLLGVIGFGLSELWAERRG